MACIALCKRGRVVIRGLESWGCGFPFSSRNVRKEWSNRPRGYLGPPFQVNRGLLGLIG
jgi:hypothetical protein